MKARIACLAIALLSLLLSGCTVIGIAVGASSDRRNARACHASWSDVRSVPRNRGVEVVLTSGDTLRGKFTGFRALPADSYRLAYDSLREQLIGSSVLPPLGESVSVDPIHGWYFSGPFRGLEAGALVIYRPDNNSTVYQPVSNTAQLRNGDGVCYNVERLRGLASARSLPSRSEFVVKSGAQTSRIPLQHIQEVWAAPRTTYYSALGGLIGMAVDMAVITALMHAWENQVWLSLGPSY